MTPYFADPKAQQDLADSLASWLGTPFLAHGAIKQVGCSCETFVLSVYKEVGFLPVDWEIPIGTIRYFRTAKGAGLMAPFLDGKPEFEQVRPLPDAVQCGDLLGFRVGRVVHHLGIALTATTFAHCMDPAGVKYNHLRDASYFRRWERLWRPVIRL